MVLSGVPRNVVRVMTPEEEREYWATVYALIFVYIIIGLSILVN